MSQLGHKLPCRPISATSGLPLKADIEADIVFVRFSAINGHHREMMD